MTEDGVPGTDVVLHASARRNAPTPPAPPPTPHDIHPAIIAAYVNPKAAPLPVNVYGYISIGLALLGTCTNVCSCGTGLGVPFLVAATITGHIGLNESKRTGSGRIESTIGMIVGGIMLALTLLLFLAIKTTFY